MSTQPPPDVSFGRRFVLRVSAVFLGLLSLPLNPDYWRAMLTADWGQRRYQDFFNLVEWRPRFLPAGIVPDWGWGSFGHLGVALLLAVVAGALWARRATTATDEARLTYGLRVLVRYRLALALFGYGIIKLIPLQFAGPTLSDLHTAYGDFLPWKIYYLTTGVAVAGYQPMLGAVELLAGLLLLERRTTVVGAGLGAAMLLNIVLANFAYELGDHVYAVTLLLLAAFLLVQDTPRLFQLLVRRRPAKAERSEPELLAGLQRWRLLGRGVVVVWLLALGGLAYTAYRGDHGRFPRTPGVPGTAGYYHVTQFSRDGVDRPLSAVDPLRWQNVVFEPWATISIASRRPVKIAPASPHLAVQPDALRDYEQAGNGGRHFYSYTYDIGTGILELQGKQDPAEHYALHFRQVTAKQIELTGIGPTGEALRVVLDRVERGYLLHEGRRRPVVIY